MQAAAHHGLLARLPPGYCLGRHYHFIHTTTSASSDKSFPDSNHSPRTASYCLDLVKRRDYEGYLCTLLLPPAARREAFALRAFNVELSSVRDAVRETTLGRMRLQFWSDALDAMYEGDGGGKKVPDHPAVSELHRSVRRRGLSQKLLHRLVDSRKTSLSDRPFDDLDQADEYGHDAFSSLNYLILECLGGGNEEGKAAGHARHAANQLGMAQGLVTLLRASPHNAARRRVLLPSRLMMEQGITSEEVVRLAARSKRDREEVAEKLALVVETTAARAQEHLDNCRFRKKYLSREQRLALLPAVAADGFLHLLHKAECNVFHPSLQSKNSWLPLSLYYHKWKRSY